VLPAYLPVNVLSSRSHIVVDLEGVLAKGAKGCYGDNPNSRSWIKVQAISLNEPDEGLRKE